MIIKLFKLLVQPIRNHISWFIHASRLVIKNKTLKIDYNARLINVTLGKYNYFSRNSLIINSAISNYSYLGENTRINNATIGKFTCIGPDVLIGLGKHPTDTFVSLHPVFFSTAKQVGESFVKEQLFDERPKRVTIGHDVWIGARVIVNENIEIGTGAIIASNSVVTKDIEPYSIVAGIPARKVKMRFKPSHIEFLLKSRWWENTSDYYMKNTEIFHNIDKFCDEYITD
nr:CatB-related O-acetyltransferase [uncultured Draconibacterium sp.]